MQVDELHIYSSIECLWFFHFTEDTDDLGEEAVSAQAMVSSIINPGIKQIYSNIILSLNC